MSGSIGSWFFICATSSLRKSFLPSEPAGFAGALGGVVVGIAGVVGPATGGLIASILHSDWDCAFDADATLGAVNGGAVLPTVRDHDRLRIRATAHQRQRPPGGVLRCDRLRGPGARAPSATPARRQRVGGLIRDRP